MEPRRPTPPLDGLQPSATCVTRPLPQRQGSSPERRNRMTRAGVSTHQRPRQMPDDDEHVLPSLSRQPNPRIRARPWPSSSGSRAASSNSPRASTPGSRSRNGRGSSQNPVYTTPDEKAPRWGGGHLARARRMKNMKTMEAGHYRRLGLMV